MNIGVDLSPVELSPAGIGQYTISLISRLVEKDKRNSYYIYTATPRFLPQAENVVVKVNRSLPLSGSRWIRAVAKDAKNKKLDAFISPSNHAFSWLFPRTVQIVHDIAPIKYPQFFSKKAAFTYKRSVKRAVKKAWKLATVSDSVRQELNELTPRQGETAVLYPGLNPWITSGQSEESEIIKQLPREFLLSVSTLEPRKNHVNMIRAYADVADRIDLPLVVVGKKGWYYKEIFDLVKNLQLESKVIFVGYVKNEELASLYSAAKGLMYVSYYEGFGIPPVEALYFDIPTLVSDLPVFKEILREYAIYTDPYDPEAISDGILELVQAKSPKAKEFVQSTYNWDNTAEALLELIEA